MMCAFACCFMLQLNLVVSYYYKNTALKYYKSATLYYCKNATNTSRLSFNSEGRSATKPQRSSPGIEGN
jgi:hypothetical protein